MISTKLSAGTVVSLSKCIKIEALLESIKTLAYSGQPKDAYEIPPKKYLLQTGFDILFNKISKGYDCEYKMA